MTRIIKTHDGTYSVQEKVFSSSGNLPKNETNLKSRIAELEKEQGEYNEI